MSEWGLDWNGGPHHMGICPICNHWNKTCTDGVCEECSELKQEKMYYAAELILKSYKPLHAEIGQLYLQNTRHSPEPYIELWKLDRLPNDEEKFFEENGYPVELSIIDVNGIEIATSSEIGWWDEGPSDDSYRDVTLQDINEIFSVYEGEVEVDFQYEPFDKDFSFVPIFLNEKVIMRAPIDSFMDFDSIEDELLE